MRLLSLLCLLLTASVASATHPVQVRTIVIKERVYVPPPVQQFQQLNTGCNDLQPIVSPQYQYVPAPAAIILQQSANYGYSGFQSQNFRQQSFSQSRGGLLGLIGGNRTTTTTTTRTRTVTR